MTETPHDMRKLIMVSEEMQNRRSGLMAPEIVEESTQNFDPRRPWHEAHDAVSRLIMRDVAKSLKERAGIPVQHQNEKEIIAQLTNGTILEIERRGLNYIARLTSTSGNTLFEETINSTEDIFNRVLKFV